MATAISELGKRLKSRKNRRSRLTLLASTELAAILGIHQPDYTQLVMGARRFAEGFPFLDALQLRLMIFRFLRGVARLALILDTDGPARRPEEPAIGAGRALFPRLCRTRHKSEGDDEVDCFHGGFVPVGQFQAHHDDYRRDGRAATGGDY